MLSYIVLFIFPDKLHFFKIVKYVKICSIHKLTNINDEIFLISLSIFLLFITHSIFCKTTKAKILLYLILFSSDIHFVKESYIKIIIKTAIYYLPKVKFFL